LLALDTPWSIHRPAAAAQPAPSTPAPQAPQQPASKPGQYALETTGRGTSPPSTANLSLRQSPDASNQKNRPAFWHPESIMSSTRVRARTLSPPVPRRDMAATIGSSTRCWSTADQLDDGADRRGPARRRREHEAGDHRERLAHVAETARLPEQLKKRIRLNPKIFAA